MSQINSFFNQGSLITRPNISLPAIDSSRGALGSMALNDSQEEWMGTMQTISILAVFLIPLFCVVHSVISRIVQLESRVDPDDLECMKRRVQRVLHNALLYEGVTVIRRREGLIYFDEEGLHYYDDTYVVQKEGWRPIRGSCNWIFLDDRYGGLVFKVGGPALRILSHSGFKTVSLTEGMRERYENMELARRVCARENLNLIYIPRERSFNVDAMGEHYFAIAQERLEISRSAGEIAADYVERLTDEHVKQLVKLIALTHMNNVDFLNLPMLKDGRIALFDFKKRGSLEEGFLGDSNLSRGGLFRLMPSEKKVELAFSKAIELGFKAPEGTLKTYTNMCREKIEKWERRKNCRTSGDIERDVFRRFVYSPDL